MFRLLSVFMVIFLIEYGNFMGIEVQAEQKPETMQIISDAFLEAYGEKYRPAQIYQYGTARTCGAASALPRLVEECLPFKVAVKLITQLHPNVV